MADDPLRVVAKGQGGARGLCTFRQDLAGHSYRSAQDALTAHAIAFDLDDPAWAAKQRDVARWFIAHDLTGIVQERAGRLHCLAFLSEPWDLASDGRAEYIARVRAVYSILKREVADLPLDTGQAQPERQFWPYTSRPDEAPARTIYMRLHGAAIDLQKVNGEAVQHARKLREAHKLAKDIEGPAELQPARELLEAAGARFIRTDAQSERWTCPYSDQHSQDNPDEACVFIRLDDSRIGCWHGHEGHTLEDLIANSGDSELVQKLYTYKGALGHALHIAEFLAQDPEPYADDPKLAVKTALLQKRVMIAADPGTGKTHAAGDLALEKAAEGERVLFLVPRHEVGDEIEARVGPTAASLNVPILRPKANLEGCRELRPDLHPHLTVLGVSPAKAGFCGGCEHLKRCPTSPVSQQWGAPELHGLTIATHANLSKALSVGTWDRIIVDETPAIVRTWDDLDPKTILEGCEPNALYSRLNLAEQVRLMLGGLEGGFETGTDLGAWLGHAAIDLGGLAKAAQDPLVRQLVTLEEAALGGARRDEKGWVGVGPAWRALRATQGNVALLDASMDPIAGRVLECEPVRVRARDAMAVSRTWHPLSTSTQRHWVGAPDEWIGSLVRHVGPLVTGLEGKRLVGFGSIEQGQMGAEALGLGEGEWTYSGRLTGLNRWDHVSIVVAWGTLLPNIEGLRRYAIAGGLDPAHYPQWVAAGNLTQVLGRARVVSPWAPKRDVALHVFGPIAPLDWAPDNANVAPPERTGRPKRDMSVSGDLARLQRTVRRLGVTETGRLVSQSRNNVHRWLKGQRPIPAKYLKLLDK